MPVSVSRSKRTFVAATGARLITVDASETFLRELAGVSDPETKRKIIGREFIRSFEGAVSEVLGESAAHGETVDFLVQGTRTGRRRVGRRHRHREHQEPPQRGRSAEDLQFKLVEPLRLLFKDEVRAVGRELGLPEEIVGRQPFPGPGLGIRIIGEVTQERLDILRHADSIAREELTAAGLDGQIWQCPSCCSRTSAASASRVTAARTVIRSCCARLQ